MCLFNDTNKTELNEALIFLMFFSYLCRSFGFVWPSSVAESQYEYRNWYETRFHFFTDTIKQETVVFSASGDGLRRSLQTKEVISNNWEKTKLINDLIKIKEKYLSISIINCEKR